MSAPVYIHQIYYNEATRSQIDAGFIPLDNTANPRPDWFEFGVIRQYLKSHPLAEGAFYGFFSPKFAWKTGLAGQQVLDFVQAHHDQDVLLFSPGWDQIAYFQNVFEQGEFWHAGLMRQMQQFVDTTPYKAPLSEMVTHSSSACFSNFVVAKPAYWRAWLLLADAFFNYAEAGADALGATTYGDYTDLFPMKTFIQERFVSLLLAGGNFTSTAYDFSEATPVFTQVFGDHPQARRWLQSCDVLKQQYAKTQDLDYLQAYRKLRGLMPCNHL